MPYLEQLHACQEEQEEEQEEGEEEEQEQEEEEVFYTEDLVSAYPGRESRRI